MARYNDTSSQIDKWTNRKLMSEARRHANLETFSAGTMRSFSQEPFPVAGDDPSDFVREETRLYRQSYLNPILDEIERRFVK